MRGHLLSDNYKQKFSKINLNNLRPEDITKIGFAQNNIIFLKNIFRFVNFLLII